MRGRIGGWAMAVALLVGCGGGGAGPPEILYGEDVCDHCRMVISERRHAAAARDESREYRFDDPGCLVDFFDAGRQGEVATAWVHDETGAWRPVGEAWFVVDPEGGTPMGSGILAYGTLEAATAAGRRYGDEPRRWRDLASVDRAATR